MKQLFAILVLASFCVLTSHAQTTPPTAAAAAATTAVTNMNPGYLIVLGRSLDRTKIIAYSATLPPIYAETGGRYIGIGRPGGGVTCVYGLCEGRSAVIARWADQKSIETFWWGDAYRKAIRLRDGAGIFTVVGLKATTNVAPYDPPGALLIATASIPAGGPSDSSAAQTWIDAATSAGARLLAPFSATAIVALEGDALYNRIALLSFESKDKRDAFAAAAATKSLLAAGPPLTVLSIIAVDAPPVAAALAPTTGASATAK